MLPRLSTKAWFDWRRLSIAVFGIVLGMLTLYLATRNVAAGEIEAVFRRIDPSWTAFAVVLYTLTLPVRGVRWWILLAQLSPQRCALVLEATIVGFAANYLLPARLGELLRADYIKRVSGLPRTAAIGSIGIERTVDGLTVVALLAFGVFALGTGVSVGRGIVNSIVLIGLLIFGGLTVFFLVVRYTHPWLATREGHVFQYALAFVGGVRSLNRRTALPIVGLTALIWVMELAVLQSMLRAFGATLDLGQLVVLGSSLTLSTIAPTAPGFLGSFQFVGGVFLESFGQGRATGIAVVTAMQLFCYLPVALAGVVIGAVRWHRLMRVHSPVPHSEMR
jgi:glycosyltransferase 2 family protein